MKKERLQEIIYKEKRKERGCRQKEQRGRGGGQRDMTDGREREWRGQRDTERNRREGPVSGTETEVEGAEGLRTGEISGLNYWY